MKTLRPNQSGTFSNRVDVADTDNTKLFTIEYSEYTSNEERLFLTEMLTCSADMLKAIKKIISAIDEHPDSAGLLNMQVNNAKSILVDIEKYGSPFSF